MTQSTIFSRVGQLVRANINDILDRAEDPEKMLDQLVRDYSNAIDEARTEVASTIGNLRIAEDDHRKTVAAAADWGDKAAAASRKADSAGDTAEEERFNALAKEALTRQVSLERQAETEASKIAADTAVVDQLKDGLTKMEQRLSDLRTKRQELVSRAKMAKAQSTVQGAIKAVNAADPTSDLSRFEDRIRQQEAQVRGQNELAAESLDEQFKSLESDEIASEADARLAALKGKTPVGSA
jgi:phage shock protein A